MVEGVAVTAPVIVKYLKDFAWTNLQVDFYIFIAITNTIRIDYRDKSENVEV